MKTGRSNYINRHVKEKQIIIKFIPEDSRKNEGKNNTSK